MVHSVGPDAPFAHGLPSQPCHFEVVVVRLVSKIRKWKASKLLLQKLQMLLSVFASKRLSALGLYRLLTKTRQCFKQTGNQLMTLTWFEAMLKPQDLVLHFSAEPSKAGIRFMLFMFAMASSKVHCCLLGSRCAHPRVVTLL